MYTHTANYHLEVSREISIVSLCRFRQIHLHNTICNGINLGGSDQTRLEDMFCPTGSTVNVVGIKKNQMAIASRRSVHELHYAVKK